MQEKFLLYIDILGFSDLVNKEPQKIREIYDVVDRLNVHKHDAFQTIIFSDTILAYNKIDPKTLDDKENIVMYMVEFVQDLLLKGNSINLNFRAILTFGKFEHFKLENIDCYYGNSLIYAYLREKDINGVGLYLDKKIKCYNQIFKTCTYNSELDFVFLLQTISHLKFLTNDELPLPSGLIETTYEFCWLEQEIDILKKYFNSLNKHENPKIRAKYLQTYQYYKNMIPNILDQLEKTDFSMKTINSEVDWNEQTNGCMK
jgi:hypothetical protein